MESTSNTLLATGGATAHAGASPAGPNSEAASRLYPDAPKPATARADASPAEKLYLEPSGFGKTSPRDVIAPEANALEGLAVALSPGATTAELKGEAAKYGATFAAAGFNKDDVRMLTSAIKASDLIPMTDAEIRANRTEYMGALRKEYGREFDKVWAASKALVQSDARLGALLNRGKAGETPQVVKRIAEIARSALVSGRLKL